MGSKEVLPPDADLFASMRHIGYSLDTAIADILDNSVAAGARNVGLSFDGEAEYIAICDDGRGMNHNELRVAMRLAGNSTTKVRHEKDLGRFGLGLKTASLSQAKRLTVVTKTSGSALFAAEWDLDRVASENEWSLYWLDSNEIDLLPNIETLKGRTSGTLVLWRNLDVLLSDAIAPAEHLTDSMARVAEHVCLVFHRIMDANPRERVNFSLNSVALKAIDPFFTSNSGTQRKPEEIVRVLGEDVRIRAFVLPHLSKMSREERISSEFLNSRFIETQGFYIYRLKRLIAFGSWFRIAPKSELAKLARVMVDISPKMDSHWKLGIMKSTLEVPNSLKSRLRAMVPEIVNESKRVVTRRGATASQGDQIGAWEFHEIGKDTFNIVLDRNSSILSRLSSELDAHQLKLLNLYLSQVELSLPIVELTTRITGDKSHAPTYSREDLFEYAIQLINVQTALGSSLESARENLAKMPPFSDDMFAKDYLKKHAKALERGYLTEEQNER